MRTFNQLNTQHSLLGLTRAVSEFLHELEIKNIGQFESNLVTSMLTDVETTINDKLSIIEFNQPYCLELNKMFESIIDFSNAKNIKIDAYLINIFHHLHYRYNEFKSAKNNTDVCYNAFTPSLLFKSVDAYKNPDDLTLEYLKSVAVGSLERKLIGVTNNGNVYIPVPLLLEDYFFETMSKSDKHELIINIVKANMKDSSPNDWAMRNLNYFANLVINENATDLGFLLFMNTIKTTTGVGTPAQFTVSNGTFNTKHAPELFSQVRYVSDKIGYTRSYLPVVNKLRASLFQSLERYEQLKNTADALDCAENQDYWRSALVGIEPESSSLAIEF